MQKSPVKEPGKELDIPAPPINEVDLLRKRQSPVHGERRKQTFRRKALDGKKYVVHPLVYAWVGESLSVARERMEKAGIDLMPVFQRDSNVGTISLDLIKQAEAEMRAGKGELFQRIQADFNGHSVPYEQLSGLEVARTGEESQVPTEFNAGEIRCNSIMGSALPVEIFDSRPDRIATIVGLHGGVLLKVGDREHERIVGMVIGREMPDGSRRIDLTKAEEGHGGRWTIKREVEQAKGKRKRVRKTKGRTSLPAIPGRGQPVIYDDHELSPLVVDEVAEVSPDVEAEIAHGKQELGKGVDELDLDHAPDDFSSLPEAEKLETLRSIAKQLGLPEPDIEAGNPFAEPVESEAIESSTERRHVVDDDRYAAYEVPYERYFPPSRIQRGSKSVSAKARQPESILLQLKVEWTDGKGNRRLEPLKDENRMLVRKILEETGKDKLLKIDSSDEVAQRRILTAARRYLKKHNAGILDKLNRNVAIYLGSGATLEQKVRSARSQDDFLPPGVKKQQKAIERKAEEDRKESKAHEQAAKERVRMHEEEMKAQRVRKEQILTKLDQVNASVGNDQFRNMSWLGQLDRMIHDDFPDITEPEVKNAIYDWGVLTRHGSRPRPKHLDDME